MEPNEMLDDQVRELEREIKSKQEELNRIRLGDVYEAQDAYRAAKENYEEAEQLVRKAARVLQEEKVKSGVYGKHTQRLFSFNNMYRV